MVMEVMGQKSCGTHCGTYRLKAGSETFLSIYLSSNNVKPLLGT